MASPKTLRMLAEVVHGQLSLPADRPEVLVTDVTHDSRQAGPGTLFVAIRGKAFDGHDFVDQAIDAGSPALCVQDPMSSGVAEIIVPNTRLALGPLAASVHGSPSSEMSVVGVTGTNGKTTVTHYVESIASAADVPTGLIGTIHTRIGGQIVVSKHTTPEASDFQRLLADMVAAGTRLVAAEVSSHALELGRVGGTDFSVATFTNLSQDHLDFHKSMDRYLASKKRLFEEYPVGTAVINVDDISGAVIADSFTGNLVRVGVDGDVRFNVGRSHGGVTEIGLETPWGSASIQCPVMGAFNVQNAVLAATSLLAAGLEFDDVIAGVSQLPGVPGRYEVVSGDDPILVIVDYAHTPEGVAVAIETARSLNAKRVIVVLGAGGDRDQRKRPLMGAAAGAADLAVITSDNPRSEDPQVIVDEIVAGAESSAEFLVIADRRAAINRAIGMAADGDIVLVLGRGHEPTQEIMGERLPFDDRVVARDALSTFRMSAKSDVKSGSMDT